MLKILIQNFINHPSKITAQELVLFVQQNDGSNATLNAILPFAEYAAENSKIFNA